MDPTACVQRILDARDANNQDEFDSAWADLAEWLTKGGFPPTVNTLNETRYIGGPNHGRYWAIMQNDERTGFVIHHYNHGGDLIKEYPCPTA